jgi:hypothetical protein
MRYRELMDEPSFEEYNDSAWVVDMTYHQTAVLQAVRTAEEEANE